MKRVTVFLPVFLLLILAGFAQEAGKATPPDPKLVAMMASQIAQLDTAQSPATYIGLANAFERIGDAAQKYWQPYYHAAFCYAVLAVKEADKSNLDDLADKAQAYLDKAIALNKNNSEISALQGMIINTRILADPMGRWRDYSAQAGEWLAKSKQQDPGNPRPWYIEARAKIRTPALLGGGPDAAKPLVTTAVEKFKTFQPENSMAPNWGGHIAIKMLEDMQKEKQ